ncbi:unnamed protein product, partial [Closterium sp. NIES-54]
MSHSPSRALHPNVNRIVLADATLQQPCFSRANHLQTRSTTAARVATLVLALAHVSLRAGASIQDLVAAAGTGSQGFGFTGKATATYYGGGLDGGNCGFGSILAAGYGPMTAAGSVMLYKDGRGCGSCY